ncbi:MAG TPA: pyridoxamine 5'-phosphate oxidase family protein [Terriglobales bacterium]|nr:pyridoxamine 5'-phosphate oxidase family protein [Terriglobales bacterium]
MSDPGTKLKGPWHEGEVEVQTRAGVREAAEELTGMYQRYVQPGMVGFLAQQRFAVLATKDAQGRVWASVVAGAPGMIQVPDLRVIRLDAKLVETRLPVEDVKGNPQAGMLVIDLGRRIRVRINGRAGVEPDGSVVIGIDQTYGNCSQYIQRRTVVREAGGGGGEARLSAKLGTEQVAMIAKADTFFIASAHPESGADASHRGGLPGFVKVESETRVIFPDYSGNNMFNTLGNVAVNPSVGLAFFDFETGTTLQLSGRATVDWESERVKQFKGARRVIDVEVEAVKETPEATSLRYRFEAYSPFLTQE